MNKNNDSEELARIIAHDGAFEEYRISAEKMTSWARELLAYREAESQPVAWIPDVGERCKVYWVNGGHNTATITEMSKSSFRYLIDRNEYEMHLDRVHKFVSLPVSASPALSQPGPRGVKFDWVDCPSVMSQTCREKQTQRATL